MNKVFSARAVSIDGYISGRTLEGKGHRPAPETHLHYEVVR